MILIGFDIDGTVDSSAGPVAWNKVRELRQLADVRIGIVSPSSYRPPDSVTAYLTSGSRADNLRLFAAAYPGAKLRLYVSNNGDMAEAAAAGFAYVDHVEFARGMS